MPRTILISGIARHADFLESDASLMAAPGPNKIAFAVSASGSLTRCSVPQPKIPASVRDPNCSIIASSASAQYHTPAFKPWLTGAESTALT